MKVFTRFLAFGVVAALALYGCNIGGGTSSPTAAPAVFIGPESGEAGSISLTVSAVNGSTAFNTVGQVINYSYTVANTGNLSLAGSVTVADDKTTSPACSAVSSVGNFDNNLDRGESIICVSSYTINQNDLNAGSVVSNATAQIAGVASNRVTTTVPMASNRVLVVTVSPNPTTYTAAGQEITYTYSVKNTGATSLGPAQFVVTDNKIPAPINCDSSTRTLAPNDSLTCSAKYNVTQADMGAANITNSVTATGGGATTAQPATSVVTRGTVSSGNFTKGTNITHNVVGGEWLYQIARCYGADIKATLAANPQIPDPHWILPAMTVTVPNIGSTNKPIYGPPCVGFYVAQVGDTWENIGTRFNADVTVLKAANKTIAAPSFGNCLKIPLNSAGGATPAQQAATACPSSGGTTPTQPAPVVIRITPPVTLTGTVQASGKIRYVFAATQGQTLTVKVLNAPANELAMAIIASNGSTLKGQDTNLTFSGAIPSTGDTNVDIVAVSGASAKNFTLEVILTTPVASPFERVADINPGTNSSDPAYLTVFKGQLYFRAAGNDNAGAELWRYDPTTKVASRVVDTWLGPEGANPAYLASYGDLLYFRANGNDGAGVELWRYNGLDDGRMPDINNGPGDSNPAYLTVFNNKLYFSAKGGDTTGVELWRTDGTGVELVADIMTGSGDSNPSHFAAFNNALYFSASSADGAGVELWKYDGANAPTRVADINPGVGNSNPSYLAVFNNVLYFAANANDGFGVEIWKYDGTNPPSRVTDINPNAGDSAPAFLTVFNGALYFSAASNDGAGFELWKYDGVNAPKRVGDLNPAGNSSPSYLAVFNNELYFQANGNDNAGTELWKYKSP
ncbi:MAG: LysM peptidoglycan-binding domain-containing protein [Anaerolineales bacterium]|nr:LysM peptidoglycan-binding domain-containing protein [Anaerolineales bacterium]